MSLAERTQFRITEQGAIKFDFSEGWEQRVPGVYDSFKNGLKGKDNVTRRKLTTLESHFTYSYSSDESDFLLRTLQLATVLTQTNERQVPDGDSTRNLRRRKLEVDGHHLLTIEHPLSAAMAIAGLPRDILLVDAKKHKRKLRLPVRQHQAGVVETAAMLLHDALEDVTIGGEEGDQIKTRIREYLGETPFTEDVITVVEAVTNYKKGVESTTQREIRNHRLHAAIVDEVSRMRNVETNEALEETKKEVAVSLADMYKMFEVCFGTAEGPGGEIQFTQENLTNFYRAFAVKMHDIENNLETTSKDIKVVRAHTYAVMARIFGLPVASRLAAHLVAEQHIGMFGDDTGYEEAQWKMLKKYTGFEYRQVKPRFQISFVNGQQQIREVDSSAVQLPIMTAQEMMHSRDRRMNPAVQLQVRFKGKDKEFFEELMSQESISVQLRSDFQQARIIRAPIHDLIRKCGRSVGYFEVVGLKDKTDAILKFVDDQPTVHDLLKYGSHVNPFDIPETKFITGDGGELHGYDGTLGSFLDIISIFNPHAMPEAA